MGLFGGSSKSSSTATDKRLVTGESSAGTSIDANRSTVAVTNNVTDGGIVSRALDSIDLANATQGEGFSRLIDAGESLIGQTQKHVADAYASATTEKAGTIDNKTLMILGVAAIAGAAIVAKGRA